MATIAGFEFDAETTEAVVTNNENPIGSGPVRFVEATPEESRSSSSATRTTFSCVRQTGESAGDATDPLTEISRAISREAGVRAALRSRYGVRHRRGAGGRRRLRGRDSLEPRPGLCPADRREADALGS